MPTIPFLRLQQASLVLPPPMVGFAEMTRILEAIADKSGRIRRTVRSDWDARCRYAWRLLVRNISPFPEHARKPCRPDKMFMHDIREEEACLMDDLVIWLRDLFEEYEWWKTEFRDGVAAVIRRDRLWIDPEDVEDLIAACDLPENSTRADVRIWLSGQPKCCPRDYPWPQAPVKADPKATTEAQIRLKVLRWKERTERQLANQEGKFLPRRLPLRSQRRS